MAQQSKWLRQPGDQLHVVGKHPRAGELAELLSFGPYGLAELNLTGWKVRGVHTREEFYCKDTELAEQPGAAPTRPAGELVPAVEAVEEPAGEALEPTVSPGRRETTLDRLRAHYAAKESKPVLLTPHQQQVLKRLEATWCLLLDQKSGEHAVKKLMKNFKVSRAQAYRDITDCKQLFGDVVKSSREADRYLLREMAMTNYRKAKKAGDFTAMNAALALLVKITGIEKADPNIPDADQLVASTYVLELKSTADKPLTLNLEAVADLPAHEYSEVLEIIENAGNTPLQMLQRITEAARGTVSE